MMLVIPKEKHQFALGRRKVLFGKQFPLNAKLPLYNLVCTAGCQKINILRLFKRRQEKLSIFAIRKSRKTCLNNSLTDF